MPRSPDIRKLARRQRWLLWFFLAGVVVQFLPLLQASLPGQVSWRLRAFSSAAHIVVYILMFVGVVRVMLVDGTHPAVIALNGIFMIAPCINLLILLLVNSGATRKLREAGLEVGLMGVDLEMVEWILNAALCTKCGYDLRGLPEARCPECFTLFDPDIVPRDQP